VLKAFMARVGQGHRTTGFPSEPPALPEAYLGTPVVDPGHCPEGCAACSDVCPTDAIAASPGALSLDLGRCVFCAECVRACPEGAIQFTRDYASSTRTRDALRVTGREFALAKALDDKARRLFGHSLKLRQVSAGGCNACEADINVLTTVVFDLGRFGIQIVASPRHADGLIVTGPVTGNMRVALQKTWEAVPAPKLVIAVGACAISGGPYIGHPETNDGVAGILPVDLFVPGCPPHPATILDGLLRLLDRRE
jgi:Ni,Fe-hydrogenase III small subunit/NAD-dependent dihydropyrimidine dehydrogenase PreA subunit